MADRAAKRGKERFGVPKPNPRMSPEEVLSLVATYQDASLETMSLPSTTQTALAKAMQHLAQQSRSDDSKEVAPAWLAHRVVQRALGRKTTLSWMPSVA